MFRYLIVVTPAFIGSASQHVQWLDGKTYDDANFEIELWINYAMEHEISGQLDLYREFPSGWQKMREVGFRRMRTVVIRQAEDWAEMIDERIA